jgi:replicative DNA helicase
MEKKREARHMTWTADKPSKSQGARLQTATSEVHRPPPHSPEAEQGILGSMLLSPRDVIGQCIEKIGPEFFYIPSHQTVYVNLVEIWRARGAIDFITFTQVMRDKKLLDGLGGASFITALYMFVPTAANADYYIDIIRDKYILRQMIAAGTEYVRRAYEEQVQVNDLLAEFERKALSIRPAEGKTERASMKEIVMCAVDNIERIYERKGSISGLATGFIELDRITGGLQNGEMIVFAARPSMGKTAIAMNIAEHVAVDCHKPVGVFSLEMSKEQLGQRLLCSRGRVNLQKVRDGFLSDRDYPALTAAASKLAGSPLLIDDEMLKVDALIARARRWKHDQHIVLLVIDYLQLLRSSGFKVNERQHEVSYVSAALKQLAKDLRIPVIVIAQLNRQPETRSGGKPRLSDLRESGSIEQDADVVALLTRPEVYEDNEESRIEKQGEAELIIAKQRNGPVGEIPLTFLKEFTRFEDRARNLQEEY